MNVEIKQIESEKSKEKYIFLIDGNEDEQTIVYKISEQFYVITENYELNSILTKWTISDFQRLSINNYSYRLETDKYYIFKEVEIKFSKRENKSFASVKVQVESEFWDKPFSMIEFANEIERNCYDDIYYYQEDEETILNGFGIRLTFYDNSESVQKYFDKIFEAYENIFQAAENNLIKELNKSSLVSYFNFPPEIETACKQYLIYFTEFLNDIGVSADSNISTHLGQTIFTVTPANKNHALELIKDTLNMYLSLPSNPEIMQINIINQDIGVQQLFSNIQFLQSQLMLGNAIIQAKDTSIKSLEISNYQLKQIIDSKNIELEKQNQGEDLIKGIVSVNKFENKGISINFGELLRRIKRKLK